MEIYFRGRLGSSEPFRIEVHPGVTPTELAILLQKHLQSTSLANVTVPPQQLILNNTPIERCSAQDWKKFTKSNSSPCMNYEHNPIEFIDAFQSLWVKAVATDILPKRKAKIEPFEVPVTSYHWIVHLKQAIIRKQFDDNDKYDFFTYGEGVTRIRQQQSSADPPDNKSFLCNILHGINSAATPVMFEDDHAAKDKYEQLAELIVDIILNYLPRGTKLIKKSLIDAYAPRAIEHYRKKGMI